MPDYLSMRGCKGPQVQALKACLAQELGHEAQTFPGLAGGELFDADTEAALRRWQAGTGLMADGIAGPHCHALLGLRKTVPLQIVPDLAAVRALFPQTKPSNIVRYLPYVTDALEALGLTDRPMILAALGTIRAETAGFMPISEYPSRFNTLPGQPPFSAYEPGTRVGRNLGNANAGDGARYRGRGFVQLTGADNYHRYTLESGVDLAGQPELANSPEVAAVLLAMYLAGKADAMRAALATAQRTGKYDAARRLVNGGVHGLEDFKSVFLLARQFWPMAAAVAGARGATRARAAQPQRPAIVRARDTRKDPPDLRDRLYQPPPTGMPDAHPPEADVQALLGNYSKLVLDQGQEGACTGFGLACVINFARWKKSGWQADLASVSPRMLYSYARRYDEYAGEDYEGSSCRGALKGWFNHGVCTESDWPYQSRPRYGYAERAAQNTLGVYYRIDIKSITDLQAAIVQAHAIFVSAFTHAGWSALERKTPSREAPTHASLPVIPFDGKASQSDGHAFALVGFNTRGFIVQNSWGERFGLGGFGVLTYADWLANGMDAWVASLGVTGVVQGRLAAGGPVPGSRAAGGVSQAQWWNEATAYDHSIVLGNDGRVSRYLTQDELTRSLLYQACGLPDQWFRSDPVGRQSAVKRLVIYAHGGLNSEKDAIERARAMGRFFTGNGCYPLFLVWKTGLCESIEDLVADAFRSEPQRAGGVREKLFDASDMLVERTIGRGPARMVWSEMKENAQFSCSTSRGGDYLGAALQNLAALWGDALEIHVVGHSAGAIILGHLLEVLAARGLNARVASAHLFAPACTVQFANRHYATHPDLMQRLWLHVLADEQEKDDSVAAIYRKSLLYLVSNALEPDLRTPILGLENVARPTYAGWDGSSTTGEALGSWRDAVRAARLDDRTHVVRSAQVPVYLPSPATAAQPKTIAASHGSFDNNVDVIGKTIERITGAPLALPVDDLRGF